MIRVLLADDETLLRRSIAALLDLGDGIEVVAQAGDGAEAVRLAGEHEPDVVLLDLEMPGMDGIDAATEILARRPEQAVVLLTRHARPGVLRRALSAGVRGFVPKSIDPDELERVIVQVHGGRRYIDADISAAAMMDDCPLTERELDTLRLTAEGLSVREMSARLHLASGTVRNYLSAAMQKTGSSSRHGAARVARERSWL
ncbi:response regulator transcription factor [Frigoribacterium sp. CFBP9039]|uniref:response regulator transcription factor n=1 Tax=Frigoribacterium TaxID=96492 RepID=UPI00177BCC22|nr:MULTISPECIES: response regulator transcription factor [Frigoribacterium]MBD8702809.1 response regulator transcription factor [Frigoribacterium sp. CFBP 13712]MCJ0702410.1 response regulator transcription factor [Frigoribacterium faeni]MDY0892675.1 response regulator transcription factor [Frigoribacterium sp. CFBP9030]MDY0945960.1 response regulator transcription factor [Frigoribacterium sp. CFBP9039]